MSAEIDLNPESESLQEIVDFLTKVTVESTENPKKFVVKYPRKTVYYNFKFRMKLIEYLLFHWFMSLEKMKVESERNSKIDYSR